MNQQVLQNNTFRSEMEPWKRDANWSSLFYEHFNKIM